MPHSSSRHGHVQSTEAGELPVPTTPFLRILALLSDAMTRAQFGPRGTIGVHGEFRWSGRPPCSSVSKCCTADATLNERMQVQAFVRGIFRSPSVSSTDFFTMLIFTVRLFSVLAILS